MVYRGHQDALGRDVAVKVLSAPDADARAVELWHREVTAMGRLSNHPNIVSAFATGVTSAGLPYLVMPYVPGGSLHDRIGAHGPLSGAEVAHLGARLASGLAAAHAAGVLHRDVKPGNVLLTEYGEPQLSDFGIARLVDAASTTTGSVRATIGYAAPEVLGGEKATPTADVYGLGASLHTALSGRPPFGGEEGEPLAARVGRVMTRPPPDLRALGVAPALAEVIEEAMAKDPTSRPQTAEEVRRRLDALDPSTLATPAAVSSPEGTAVMPAAAPQGPEPPAGSPGARNRGQVLVAAAAVVVLILVAGLVWWALAGRGGDSTEAGPVPSTTEPSPPAAGPTTSPLPEPPPSSSTPSSTTTPPTSIEVPTTATTTSPSPSAPPDAADLRAAVTDYYALVDSGDLEAAYALLSPGFQADQPFARYQDFWNGIDSVTVRGRPEVDVEAMRATARLRYIRADGSRSDEAITLTFVVGDDGTLLIDRDSAGSDDGEDD